jgi:uncharacterized membrane protein
MAILLAATIATGLIAGLFFAYANNVMPALRLVDDHCFVSTMQRINRVILNPLFLVTFVGGLLLTIASAVTVGVRDERGILWAVAAIALYLVMLAITGSVNVPLNDQLERAGDVSRIDDLEQVEPGSSRGIPRCLRLPSDHTGPELAPGGQRDPRPTSHRHGQ